MSGEFWRQVHVLRNRFFRRHSTAILQPNDTIQPDLPSTLAQLEAEFEVAQGDPESNWDFLWNVPGEDVRERGLFKLPISESVRVSRQVESLDDKDAMAEIAIKVTSGFKDSCAHVDSLISDDARNTRRSVQRGHRPKSPRSVWRLSHLHRSGSHGET